MSVYKIELSNKIVVITGGYGHLGSAIVRSLHEHGAKVYVLGRDQSKFDQAFEASQYRQVIFQNCDIADTSSILAAFENVNKKEGRIDVLINNAVYLKGQSPETMTDEEWNYSLEGTLGSVFKCIREIIPYFRSAGKGNIVNVSSMYGVVAPDFSVYDNSPNFLNPPHYEAAKAGVLQLTRYYASYLGRQNVNVNAVTPGPFPSLEVQKDIEFISRLSDKTCLGRIGLPEDIAGIFVFLASDAAKFVTGQNFIIDGGWTAK